MGKILEVNSGGLAKGGRRVHDGYVYFGNPTFKPQNVK